MKKNILAMTLIILTASAALISAQGMKEGMKDKNMKAGVMGEGRMGKDGMGMMGKEMMGKMMMCPMMKSMMDKNVIAASDGGVIIVAGNKLTKYDKDLNVVKEIELKMDMEGMQKNMMEMMKNCPMMGKGMMGNKESKDETPSTEESSEKAEHESHH